MNGPIIFWVGAGAALGGLIRVGVSLLIPGGGFPFATLGVNVIGSFIIGLFAALAGPDGRLLVGPAVRQFLMTGVCGGLTTFSIFSLESMELLAAGRPWLSAAYVAASLAGWLAAVWLGYAWGESLNRTRPGGARDAS